MIKGKTESGFNFKIDEATFNDMELLELLVDADNGNYLAISKVLDIILGQDQKKKLYDHVRNDNGRVQIDLVTNEVRRSSHFRVQRQKTRLPRPCDQRVRG